MGDDNHHERASDEENSEVRVLGHVRRRFIRTATTPDMPADHVYTVTEVYPTHVVLDGNHPLAGIALRLALTVRDVREATGEEIDAGSVGQPVLSVMDSAPSGSSLH